MNPRRLVLEISLLLIVAGCGGKAQLTFMTGGAPHEFGFWQELCVDFEAKTGIHVEMIRSATKTGQRKQQIQVGLRGRKADPDVFSMDIAWIGQFAYSGWLEPLDKYGIDPSPCFQNVIDLADRHQGALIGMPLWVDAGLLYYRKDLLEKYGYAAPPQTWHELVEMAEMVQKGERRRNPDFWGFVWQGAQYEGLVCNTLEYFVSAGGGFLDASGAPIIDCAPNKAALGFMADLIHGRAVSPPNVFTDMKEEESRMVFQNGSALFQRNWPYAMKLHDQDDSPVKGKFDITVLPRFGDQRSAATLGGWHVGMSTFSDRKKDAAEFVRYLCSFEVQKKMATQLAHNPGRLDVYDDEDVKGTMVGGLRDMFYTAIPRPPVPYYPHISSVLQKYVNAAIAAKMSPDEALTAAQKEVVAVVKEYGQ